MKRAFCDVCGEPVQGPTFLTADLGHRYNLDAVIRVNSLIDWQARHEYKDQDVCPRCMMNAIVDAAKQAAAWLESNPLNPDAKKAP